MEDNKLYIDVEEKPKKLSEWLLFSLQHILAMLVACITVPLLTGLPIAATIVSAGIGTLIYVLFTKGKSPVFLSSSFAYIAPISSAMAVGMIGNGTGNNYAAIMIGMIMVGLIYAIVALVIKFVGTAWISKILPPIIVGPVIMAIGLSLAGSAVSNISSAPVSNSPAYNWCALTSGIVALFATAFASHYGKKMTKLIPFVIGMGAGYITAILFTVFGYYIGGNEYYRVIDFTPLVEIFSAENISFASFFNYKLFVPNDPESFIFLRFNELSRFDWAQIGSVALLFIPVAFVTMCEHIGDHENLGNIIGRDLLNGEPGMSRTLAGDGIATAVSGILSGVANTTYGENVAVIGMTKIASTAVIISAALMSVAFGFFTPFTALLKTIPSCVTGGVSLILYGFIASSGIKMLIKEKIDLTNTKNIFIASVILVSGIGGLIFKFGNPDKPAITITSIAVAMFLGIILNLVLVEKKNKKTEVKEVEVKEETASIEETK